MEENLLPVGTIAAVRVNRIHTQPRPGARARSLVANEVVKGVLGTVPVEADGSVCFRVPSGEPLQFQALDRQGRAVMTMRSFTFLQPGEVQGCVGCHEPRNSTPFMKSIMPVGLTPRALTPPDYGGDGMPLHFRKIVQPVLDRHCIACHGLTRTEGGVILTSLATVAGKPKPGGDFSPAYGALADEKKGYVKLAHRNRETVPSRPDDYFARAGKLYDIITVKHKDRVHLSADDLRRVVEWLDLNCQYCSYEGDQFVSINPNTEQALRQQIAKTFGEVVSKQPIQALVNDAAPEESRILKAPLAVSASGWGQIDPQWKSIQDEGYQKMLALVQSALPSTPTRQDSKSTTVFQK